MTKKAKLNKKVCTTTGDNKNQVDKETSGNDSMEILISVDAAENTTLDGKESDLACSENEEDENEDSEVEEEWELKKIMSVGAVTHQCPIKCSHDDCTLVAATIWVSNQKPNENWYSCLDCQENDFDGWPDLDELPVKHMTDEQKKALIEHCSKYKDCEMPNFELSPTKDNNIPFKRTPNTITPPPLSGILDKQQESSSDGPCTVTPMNGEAGKQKKAATEVKPSKAQLEIHQKWQAAAEAAGGPNARIVLHKPIAKKIIFDFLFDSFRPMHITDIHKGLKALIPSPILKACLDDMALGNDFPAQFIESESEGDDDVPKKLATTKVKENSSRNIQFQHSLSFKGSKGSNSGLYYVNYNDSKDGGGLDRDEKNNLLSDLATVRSKHESLHNAVNAIRLTTSQLLLEPLNKDLNNMLTTAESKLIDLGEQLDVARQYVVNEKDKEKTKKRIEYFSSFWRKRRKLCLDFLIGFEELTEGAVTAKGCLSGNGPIDIDSDEAIVKLALEFAKKKRSRTIASKSGSSSAKSDIGKSTIHPSETFVAVKLDSRGSVERVHIHDDLSEK